MTPLNFPKLTRTKTEALQFAAEIFPGERIALARLKPGTTHPRYQLTHAPRHRSAPSCFGSTSRSRRFTSGTVALVLDLAHRAVIQLDENAQAKVRDLYAEDRTAVWQKHQAAQIMTGDGQGI